VVQAEGGAETGIVRTTFVEAGKIHGTVSHQKEHRDHGRNGIKIASKYTNLSDKRGENNGASWLAQTTAAEAEPAKTAKHVVAGKSLQDAGGGAPIILPRAEDSVAQITPA